MGCRAIILLTGMPGAGKSVFAEVAKRNGFPVISLGDVVREEVRKRGLEPTLENALRIANELRMKMGKEAIAKIALPKVLESCKSSCIVIVDGIRSIEEVETIKRGVGVKEYLIVAVHASPRTRFQRILDRGRQGDPRDFEEFKKRDFEELSWGLGTVIALADVILVNEDTIEKFKLEVEKFLTMVYNKWCTSE
jgi:dephospho-CoA kinase